jgi:hypothetical protein
LSSLYNITFHIQQSSVTEVSWFSSLHEEPPQGAGEPRIER